MSLDFTGSHLLSLALTGSHWFSLVLTVSHWLSLTFTALAVTGTNGTGGELWLPEVLGSAGADYRCIPHTSLFTLNTSLFTLQS